MKELLWAQNKLANKQVKENNVERRRAMAKEGSRRFREKEHLNVLKSVHRVVSYFSILPCDLKHTQFCFN